MIDRCHGCEGSERTSCWRIEWRCERFAELDRLIAAGIGDAPIIGLPHGEKRRQELERYAARMRAGQTPFFRARYGRGQWGTGPERRTAAIRGADRRVYKP
jgi:hypothetical protein